MRIKAITLLFAVITSIYAASAQKSITVVNAGRSNYTIVIPAKPNSLETRGANTLQEYIFKMSGLKLPISSVEKPADAFQIVIGKTNKIPSAELKGLNEDGILIRSINNTVVITGGNRVGLLYAVHSFIEDILGCQALTADVIDIPKKSTITIPAALNKKENPSFLYRTTFFPVILAPNASSYEFCDWRKLNYYTENWGLMAHSFETLLPKAQYFATHPEYYALVNGQRNPVQPDLTNPHVLNIVVENLRNLMKGKPGPRLWSVSQNDTPTNQEHCECPNCRKLDTEQGSPQGSLLTFVNAVARRFPDKMITTLAYGYSEPPPKTLRPDKNVMIMLTATSQNVLRPLASNPSSSFNQHLKKWGSITNNLFLWDYIVKFDQTLLPLPNIKVLQSNLQHFSKNNVKYLFEQGSGEVMGEFSELKCYLVAKLMWDVNINIDAAINRFVDGYYGKTGGSYVRQYLDALHKNATATNPVMYTSGDINNAFKSYLSSNNINTYKNIFKKALVAVDSNNVYGKRILKEYTSVLYAELENNKSLFSQPKQAGRVNKSAYINSLDYGYKKIKASNITFLSEGRSHVDDYYKSYSKQLNE